MNKFFVIAIILYVKILPVSSFVVFPHCSMNFAVFWAGPNSSFLFRVCSAFADLGFFDLMYLQCSVNLVIMSLEVCPLYLRLEVWHKTSYMPLFFKPFCGGPCFPIYLAMVLVGRNDIHGCVSLNMLVIFLIAGLKYLKVVHFLRYGSTVSSCPCLEICLFSRFIIQCV
jgi:hypothetical protein